jgi:hypothetical protein
LGRQGSGTYAEERRGCERGGDGRDSGAGEAVVEEGTERRGGREAEKGRRSVEDGDVGDGHGGAREDRRRAGHLRRSRHRFQTDVDINSTDILIPTHNQISVLITLGSCALTKELDIFIPIFLFILFRQ